MITRPTVPIRPGPERMKRRRAATHGDGAGRTTGAGTARAAGTAATPCPLATSGSGTAMSGAPGWAKQRARAGAVLRPPERIANPPAAGGKPPRYGREGAGQRLAADTA